MKERKPNGYWKDFGNVKRELKPIIKELGYFPTHKELYKRGLSGLVDAIKEYHGGTNKVKEKIGCKKVITGYWKKPPGYWKNLENIRYYLEPIIKEIRRFPTQRELIKKGLKGLTIAIYRYHGGLNRIRDLMGYASYKNILIKEACSLEQGIYTYFRHIEECKCEGKKVTKLQNFFFRYNPETLKVVAQGYGPLGKYVQRYHKEMRKLEGKIE